MELNTYLHFDGRCEEAFKFYEKVLGGKIEAMIPHEGTPAANHVPTEWRSKIMHANLVVDGQALMGSDAPPDDTRNRKASPPRWRLRTRPRQSASSTRWLKTGK